MSNRERLTPSRIKAFSCPSGKQQAFFFDTEVPRLAVRVTSAGVKSFVFESKLNRQTIRRTIGSADAWSVGDAREEARRLQVLVDSGVDPREQEREKIAQGERARQEEEQLKRAQEHAARYTLDGLCNAYADYLKVRGKNKSSSDARSAFKVHVLEAWPSEANLPANTVTSTQVAAIVRKVRESGKVRTAGILRNYLVAAFNAARRAPFDSAMGDELIAFNITTNPAEAVPAIPVNRGDRVLSRSELGGYLKSLGTRPEDCALRLAIFCGGQRMAQLLRASVSDYDSSTQTLRLLDGKGKRVAPREHLVPLAPIGAALVSCLATGKTLFTTERGTRLTERAVGARCSEICAEMGVPPFDLRDIRRTAETMLAGLRVSKDLRAQLLSHGIGGVQAAHYDRWEYIDEKRAVLEQWEKHLAAIEGTLSEERVALMKEAGFAALSEAIQATQVALAAQDAQAAS